MTGTDKQIGWAERIRAERLGQLDAWYSHARSRIAEDMIEQPDLAETASVMAAIVERLHAQDSAAWWIDHRFDEMHSLFRAVGPLDLRESFILYDDYR